MNTTYNLSLLGENWLHSFTDFFVDEMMNRRIFEQ